jgi:hypothetical protein
MRHSLNFWRSLLQTVFDAPATHRPVPTHRKLCGEQLEWRELLATISVGNLSVPLGTSTVQVPILVAPTTAGEMIGAMNISFAAGAAGNAIGILNSGAEFNGSIWSGAGKSFFGAAGTPKSHNVQSAVAMLSPLQVPANGTVITYTLSTAGLAAGQYALNPNFIVNGAGTSADTTITSFTGGTLTIVGTGSSMPPVVNNQTFSIAENSANGAVVGTIVASDPDGTISSYSAPGAGPAFAVNGATGQITVANSALLNFEATPSFSFGVTVTDNTGVTDTATITINLSNVNDAPNLNNVTFSVNENSANGTVVGTVVATDQDTAAPNNTLTYAITGGNTGNAFSIIPATGQLRVNNTAVLDFETTPTFALTVQVNDGGVPSLSDTATVTVNLNNLPDTPGPSGLTAMVTPGMVNEGQSVTLTGSFTAAAAGTHTLNIAWGDTQVDIVPLPAGTTSFSRTHLYSDDRPTGTTQDTNQIVVTVSDSAGSSVSNNSQSVLVKNVAPTFASLAISPNVLAPEDFVSVQGTIADAGADSHTLDVDFNGDGTFETTGLVVPSGGAFSFLLPVNLPAGTYQSRVRARDDDGGTVTGTVEIMVRISGSEVNGVHLFYNNSAFDGNGPMVSMADFAAIATDKEPLSFGETGTFENISGYSRGINGIFIDISEARGNGFHIDASDFTFTVGNNNTPGTWAAAPAPASIGVIADGAPDASDRVFITWNDGAIIDTWLRVTVKANQDTLLAEPFDFFFGAAPGETGAGFSPSVVGVDAADFQSIALDLTPLAMSGTEAVDNPNDVNRDRTNNAFDFQVVALNLDTIVINYITPQMPAPGVATASASIAAPLVFDQQAAGQSSPDDGSSASKDVVFGQFLPLDEPQDGRVGSLLSTAHDRAMELLAAPGTAPGDAPLDLELEGVDHDWPTLI